MIEFLVVMVFYPILITTFALGLIKLFDYISDSDIWIKKEDRDQ